MIKLENLIHRIRELKIETSNCSGQLIIKEIGYSYYLVNLNIQFQSNNLKTLLLKVCDYIVENREKSYPKKYDGEKKQKYGEIPKKKYKLKKKSVCQIIKV